MFLMAVGRFCFFIVLLYLKMAASLIALFSSLQNQIIPFLLNVLLSGRVCHLVLQPFYLIPLWKARLATVTHLSAMLRKWKQWLHVSQRQYSFQGFFHISFFLLFFFPLLTTMTLMRNIYHGMHADSHIFLNILHKHLDYWAG